MSRAGAKRYVLVDDRFHNVYLEQPVRKKRKEDDSGSKLQSDTQPVYKMKARDPRRSIRGKK